MSEHLFETDFKHMFIILMLKFVLNIVLVSSTWLALGDIKFKITSAEARIELATVEKL